MARNRTPQGKAEVSGRTTINPGRFEGRRTPPGKRPLGEPYLRMTDAQKEVWEECRAEMPWLHSAHRLLLRQACVLAARMDTDPEFGVSATQALSSILSKLGATPVDETKVMHGDGEDEDPADQFFSRPN
jgi:hypothetical protein